MTDQLTLDGCGCCEGIEVLTPRSIVNRPGLSAIAYRIGTHAAFLESMKARLSTLAIEVDAGDSPTGVARNAAQTVYPLQGLTTRAPNDFSIALLDSWATVADVLMFYQERLANEHYLRTATERRSVLELARLVGYALRPGVAATVYLAYTIESTHRDPVEIAIGTRAQSLPAPGELPQAFETSDKLEARAAWNALTPRMTQAQTRASVVNAAPADSPADAVTYSRVYVKGVTPNLKADDALLIQYGEATPEFHRVREVVTDATNNRTLVWLQTKPARLNGLLLTDADMDRDRLGDEDALADYVAALNTAVDDHLELKKHRVDAPSEMRTRVAALLHAFQDELNKAISPRLLTEALRNSLLPKLSEERDVAVQSNYTRLRDWLNSLVQALEKAADDASDPLASGAARGFALGDAVYYPPDPPPEPPPLHLPDDEFQAVFENLDKSASVPPANTLQLVRSVDRAFANNADNALQALYAMRPELRDKLSAAVSNVDVKRIRDTPPDGLMRRRGFAARDVTEDEVRVYALRVKTAPFGHNAPPKTSVVSTIDANDKSKTTTVLTYGEWTINDPLNNGGGTGKVHEVRRLVLDGDHAISPGPDSWIVIQKPGGVAPTIQSLSANSVTHASATGYGLTGKTTALSLTADWIAANATLDDARKTVVYAQSEALVLAEEPIPDDIADGKESPIVLDGFYGDLVAGRWAIVAGERADLGDITGVSDAELVMLATVNHVTDDVGGKKRTRVQLAENLAYRYKRDTVTIYGNVVKATHGETRSEALGSGDGSQSFQAFTLKQPPLTYVAAPTPAGAESTLKVYVNDIEWHETDALVGLDATSRKFMTRTADDEKDQGKTTLIFGNGQQGARLPTGQENVKSVYRSGMGKSGNVPARQVSLLASRPQGVKGVINPLRASGGADKETRDQARRNVPVALMALDRLVSVQDYADFTRTFAGVGKALAALLPEGQRQIVHLTIAGADDIPIDPSSDLYRNLVRVLRRYGDVNLPFRVETRELKLLVISAGIHLLPDYVWEPTASQVRVALLDALSFENRELGQDVMLSEVIQVMQSVAGVAYVDVDFLGGIAEKKAAENGARVLLTPKQIADEVQSLIDAQKQAKRTRPDERLLVNLADVEKGGIRPAQLAFLSPLVPDTLILNQV